VKVRIHDTRYKEKGKWKSPEPAECTERKESRGIREEKVIDLKKGNYGAALIRRMNTTKRKRRMAEKRKKVSKTTG